MKENRSSGLNKTLNRLCSKLLLQFNSNKRVAGGFSLDLNDGHFQRFVFMLELRYN